MEGVRAVKAAVEFLRNYEIIAKKISETPMLTVTEVTAKAVKVIDGNLNAVLSELKNAKDVKAVQFLAESSKFSAKTRERAAELLKILMPAFENNEQK